MATDPNYVRPLTPEGIGSFVHLFDRPQNQDGSQGAFGMKLLIPKTSTNWMQDLPWLWADISRALGEAFPNGQGMPPVFAQYGVGGLWPVSDGDAANSLGKIVEEHRGNWVLGLSSGNFNTATNLVKPGAEGQCVPVTKEECWSGCKFKVQFEAYYYVKRGRLCLSMENVLLTAPGEKFGGGGGQDAATAFGLAPAVQTAAAAFQPGAAPVPGMPTTPTATGPVGAPPAAPQTGYGAPPPSPAAGVAQAPQGADWLR